jgi:hypothetical protein
MRAYIAWQGDDRLNRRIEGWTPDACAAPLGIAVHDPIIVGRNGHASVEGLN